jgi:c-di-GMP-binding flagellar brake protein YcgR
MISAMTEQMLRGAKGKEWRHHARFPLDQWIDYRKVDRSQLKPCFCEDISMGGARLVLRESLSFGKLVLVHIRYQVPAGDNQFDLVAMVVRVHKGIASLQEGYRVGVQFLLNGQSFSMVQGLIQAIAEEAPVQFRALSVSVDPKA